MFTIHPLYSSSSGNMFHIASSNSNILIDVGVSYKAINEGLKSIGLTIKDIDAILITHEHVDHIKGLSLLCRKNEIPIYAVGKTARYLRDMLDDKNIPANIISLDYGDPYPIGDIEVIPFETSHDAVMPCGYKLLGLDGDIITYATDLGYVSEDVFKHLATSNFTILESNYDETMIDFGSYPYLLKRRIKSQTGHLSNDACAQTVARLTELGQTKFLFAHMSENNNTIDIARQTIESTLSSVGANLENLELNFATKTLSSEEYRTC